MAVAELPTAATTTRVCHGDSAQEVINGRLYRTANLVQTYVVTKLHPTESTALVRYREHIECRRVLDLGCGAGRLASYLRPLTTQYVGLDVSAYMVNYCRQAFPELEFAQGDMRSLQQFKDASFDSIFAVANLFDAVSHGERLQVLAEVRRLLVPGGVLIFSAHNRNYALAGTGPRLKLQRNPLTLLRAVIDYLQASANHRRIKPFHRFESEYALLNDSGNNYHTLHYYISRDIQARQLEAHGFKLLECLHTTGYTLRDGDRDDMCPSIHYVARKI